MLKDNTDLFNHTTEIVPYTFELLEVKLKKLRKSLQDAEWENNISKVNKLKYDIIGVERSIALGEKYDVPF